MKLPWDILTHLNAYDFHTFRGIGGRLNQAFSSEGVRVVDSPHLQEITNLKCTGVLLSNAEKLELLDIISDEQDRIIETAGHHPNYKQLVTAPQHVHQHIQDDKLTSTLNFSLAGFSQNLPEALARYTTVDTSTLSQIRQHNILKGQLFEHLSYLLLLLIYINQDVVHQPCTRYNEDEETGKINYQTRADFLVNKTLYEMKFGRDTDTIKRSKTKYAEFVENESLDYQVLTFTENTDVSDSMTCKELIEEHSTTLNKLFERYQIKRSNNPVLEIIKLINEIDKGNPSDEKTEDVSKINSLLYHVCHKASLLKGHAREKYLMEFLSNYLYGRITKSNQLYTIFKTPYEAFENLPVPEYQASVLFEDQWHESFIQPLSRTPEYFYPMSLNIHYKDQIFDLHTLLKSNTHHSRPEDFATRHSFTFQHVAASELASIADLQSSRCFQTRTQAIFQAMWKVPFSHACQQNTIQLHESTRASLV